MPRPPSRHPTELELEILKVLWGRGPASGRKVRDALAPVRDLAYTSVMTTLGIMEEKGYVRRRKTAAGYVYASKLKRDDARHGMLRDIVERAFEGSAASAMLNLLQSSDLNHAELAELRRLIDQKKKGQA